MKRITIIFASAVIVISFGALVRYAYVHKRGAPVERSDEPKRTQLQIPYIEKEINLKETILNPRPWNEIEGVDLNLVYQVTVTPWGTSLIPGLNVKAFHNGEMIYFKLSYIDKTKNDAIAIAKFSDGASIMFPIGESHEVKPESIMMGFRGKVNIWHWRALEDKDYWTGNKDKETGIEIRSPVADLVATGITTLSPKKEQRVLGRGYKTEEGWDVIFARRISVDSPGEDAEFRAGKKYLCAFAVWDGEREDRGPRKSISDYIEFVIGKKR